MKHWQNFYGMKVLLEIKFSFLFVVVYKKIETKTNEQIFTVYIYSKGHIHISHEQLRYGIKRERNKENWRWDTHTHTHLRTHTKTHTQNSNWKFYYFAHSLVYFRTTLRSFASLDGRRQQQMVRKEKKKKKVKFQMIIKM